MNQSELWIMIFSELNLWVTLIDVEADLPMDHLNRGDVVLGWGKVAFRDRTSFRTSDLCCMRYAFRTSNVWSIELSNYGEGILIKEILAMMQTFEQTAGQAGSLNDQILDVV